MSRLARLLWGWGWSGGREDGIDAASRAQCDVIVKRFYDHGIAIAAAGAAWSHDFMTTEELDAEIASRLDAITREAAFHCWDTSLESRP